MARQRPPAAPRPAAYAAGAKLDVSLATKAKTGGVGNAAGAGAPTVNPWLPRTVSTPPASVAAVTPMSSMPTTTTAAAAAPASASAAAKPSAGGGAAPNPWLPRGYSSSPVAADKESD